MNETLQYFNGNKLAADVWSSKYALKKHEKQIESTPAQMHKRMTNEFARIESKFGGKNTLSEEKIFDLFDNFRKVIPQGSIMAILGNPNQIGSLSNCIVLPKVHDSYGGIMYTDQQLSQVMKRRCGAGIDISTLRPSGSAVSNAAQTSTGAVSFMHRFSNTTREVAQDGRRGALMITMDIRHPEAEQFAIIKQDLSKVTGANISLKVTDEFMETVQNKQDFFQRFPIEALRPDESEIDDMEYDRLETWANAQVKKVDSNKLWNTIIGAAHKSAEPGLIFWDRQHRYSPSSLYKEFENISTNPCSEIAMNHDSCRLIALNMFSCVELPFTHTASFDFEEWYWMNYNGMRLIDDLVELELEHINRIRTKIYKDSEPNNIKQVELDTWNALYNSAVQGRRTGLGFTALGDTLAALGLKYDTDEAISLVEKMMQVKLAAELDATIDLAEERGAFPAFDAKLELKLSNEEDTFFYFLRTQFPQQWERMQKVGRRNISWSTVAPTGSLSLLSNLKAQFFGTTSGIEPLFSTHYIRRKKINPNDKEGRVDFIDASGDKWQEFPVFHEGLLLWYQINFPEQNIYDLSKQELAEIIKLSPYAGATAPEINWKQRVKMQGVIQKYITHSISSTINLPNDVSTDEVSEIYFESWKQGLKGITVYRDGSRSGVLITEPTKKEEGFHYHDAPKRPKELEAELSLISARGNLYAVIIGFLNGKPYEVFSFDAHRDRYGDLVSGKGRIIKNKKGQYIFKGEKDAITNIQSAALHADEQMLTRLVSGMMRHGVNPKFIIEQIDKCPLEVVSFGRALSRVIRKYIPEKELMERAKCKDCGSTNLKFEEGCQSCNECGSSKCV